MPIVEIKMWSGRSKEKKQNLIKRVTEAVAEALDASPEAVTVIIHEVPKEHWAQGGKAFA